MNRTAKVFKQGYDRKIVMNKDNEKIVVPGSRKVLEGRLQGLIGLKNSQNGVNRTATVLKQGRQNRTIILLMSSVDSL